MDRKSPLHFIVNQRDRILANDYRDNICELSDRRSFLRGGSYCLRETLWLPVAYNPYAHRIMMRKYEMGPGRLTD